MAPAPLRLITALSLSATTLCAAQVSERFLQARVPEPKPPAEVSARRRIKVITDMGFDDWGAFAVLNAVGLDPEAALATNGMMKPTEFATDFAKLLDSWGLKTQVYNGTEECYTSACPDTSFIAAPDGWGYSPKLMDIFPHALGGGHAGAGETHRGLNFWMAGGCDTKYTLLVLSPASDVARDLTANPGLRDCIEEIVVAGGFYENSAQGSTLPDDDPSTANDILVGPASDIMTGTQAHELNVVADAPAAKQLLSLGIPVRVIPIEVDSVDRIGKELMAVLGPAGPTHLKGEAQVNLTTQSYMQLCQRGLGKEDPSMLGFLACLHSAGGSLATLDMDAIAASYLWKPELFTFATQRVNINATTGLTSLCEPGAQDDDCSGEVQVATDFSTVDWMQSLHDALSLHVSRNVNCVASSSTPVLRSETEHAAVTRCWQECKGLQACTGFVTSADRGAYNCYLAAEEDKCEACEGSTTYFIKSTLGSFKKHEGYNCYSVGGVDHGADEPTSLPEDLNQPYLSRIVAGDLPKATVELAATKACGQGCAAVQGCTGFVLAEDKGTFSCYLRSNIRLQQCDQDTVGQYTTYTLES
mmetsp:Transcript_64107/g.164976  ORF Transcript_64107/g.164976 Transcript_64107/m.164976 type:complete len:587 (-) Transcript_64107:528-2288(-)